MTAPHDKAPHATPHAHVPHVPKQHKVGHYIRIKDKHDPRDVGYKATAPVDIPEVVDMRADCSEIENQGELGSCTAHACVAALEYAINKQREKAVRLSRRFVYYNERMIEGTISEDAGGQIRDVVRAAGKYGACSELLWPYDEQAFADQPSDDCYVEGKQHLAVAYRRVHQDRHGNDIQHALASGFPVLFGIYVYDSFESEEVAANGLVPIPSHKEKCVGGHAILIVGYDRTKQVYIVRNSWGPEWGDKGYCYLPFDYVHSPDLSEDFWCIVQVT